MNQEKLDIVIQGRYDDYTDEIIDSYLKLPFLNKVIVSCWEDNKNSIYKRGTTFLRNEYPQSPGTDNRNLQIVSSLNGLKLCETKFSIKMRSDQKFSYDSMMKMFDFFMENNQASISFQYDHQKPRNKILVAGWYPGLLFCPRDHIFWGNTDDLVDLFDIPLEINGFIQKVKVPKERLWMYYNYFIRTETYIGAHYCSNFDETVNRFLLKPEEHLYDGAVYWYYTKDFSDRITPSVFKSFPKEVINFDWPCKKDFTIQSYLDACSWCEDFFNIN
jgi:hypothetical protein